MKVFVVYGIKKHTILVPEKSKYKYRDEIKTELLQEVGVFFKKKDAEKYRAILKKKYSDKFYTSVYIKEKDVV